MTVVILRHTPGNTLGHLEEILLDFQSNIRYWEMHEKGPEPMPIPRDLAGLVILGGPQNVDQIEQYPFLLPERTFIKDVIEAGIPTFGICLGAQLIARSLGGTVRKNSIDEIGWTPISLSPEGLLDPVLTQLGSETPQFQWHGDTFTIPSGAVHLASTPACPNQAYRLNPQVYGVQFHPEIPQEQIEKWLKESKNLPQDRKEIILEQTQTTYGQSKMRSQAMFAQYCKTVF